MAHVPGLHRLTVDDDATGVGLGVVRALHQLDRGRLAAATLADEPDRLACRHVQREATQHAVLRHRRVREGDVLKRDLNPAVHGREGLGGRVVGVGLDGTL
eukprot:1060341-Prymnesium_polylepis.1